MRTHGKGAGSDGKGCQMPPSKYGPQQRREGRNVEWKPTRLPCILRKFRHSQGSLLAKVCHKRNPLPSRTGPVLEVLPCARVGKEQPMRKHGPHMNVMVDFGAGGGLFSPCAFSGWRTVKCLWPPQDPHDRFSHGTLCFCVIQLCHTCSDVFICKSFPGMKTASGVHHRVPEVRAVPARSWRSAKPVSQCGLLCRVCK